MRFYIEMERHGADGEVLVTLRDGPAPDVGAMLRDEGGATWRVTKHHPTEVALEPLPPRPLADKAVPKGKALTTVRCDARAA